MTEPSITLESAGSERIGHVEALLAANDLPYRDVRSNPERFFLATCGGEVIGVGGLEVYGSDGLLRSIVVEESARGRGYGTALCDGLERRARDDGVDALYLLTTTAPEFFRRCGYEEIDRREAPPSVRGTTEFEDLCPASAVCMKKDVR